MTQWMTGTCELTLDILSNQGLWGDILGTAIVLGTATIGSIETKKKYTIIY